MDPGIVVYLRGFRLDHDLGPYSVIVAYGRVFCLHTCLGSASCIITRVMGICLKFGVGTNTGSIPCYNTIFTGATTKGRIVKLLLGCEDVNPDMSNKSTLTPAIGFFRYDTSRW